MNVTAHAWAQLALDNVHRIYQYRKYRDEAMENARIARALVGPQTAKAWVAGARAHNRYAVQAAKSSREYLARVKES